MTAASKLDRDHREAIWKVLVEDCGVKRTDKALREQFDLHYPGCIEFRFVGSLGTGGKVWWNGRRATVSCYEEDATPERRAAMRRANDRLHRLVPDVVGPITRGH